MGNSDNIAAFCKKKCSDQDKRIIIIGGGAAGLAAAISAAQEGAQVLVLEAEKRAGQKILKTGNGRCNLTNAQVCNSDYNNPLFVEPLLKKYPTKLVLEFFEDLGLLTVEEKEGRIYPLSNSANTVLDVLRSACMRLNVGVLCGRKVIDVQVESLHTDGIIMCVTCADTSKYYASRVIVATGGGSNLIESMGHSIAAFQPVLCPLKTDTAPIKGLSGVRAHVAITRYMNEYAYDDVTVMTGEILFRDYGVSGIVIFDMSRVVQPGDHLGIDFIPQKIEEEFLEWLRDRHTKLAACNNNGKAHKLSLSELLNGCFHTRINDAIARAAGYQSTDLVSDDVLPKIVAATKDFRIKITGYGDVAQAQVMRGGANVFEFDACTLESNLCKGLYAAGEALDVDGRCGGFNLHWAWISGIAAGKASATSLF